MTRIIALFILSWMVCLVSCIDEVDLNIETENRTLVVDGFISDLEGDFQLFLSYSSIIGVGRDNILGPVSGANVQLMDSDGATHPYLEENEGAYILKSFNAKRNKSYFIDIILTDGRHYQSRPATFRSSSLINSISYEVSEKTFRNNLGEFVKEDVISVKLETDVSGAQDPPFLRWRVEGEYALAENYPNAVSPRACYIKTNLDLNDVRVFDTSDLSDGKLFDQVIAETEYNYRFSEQFCFHIFQFSISEDEYNYWNNIKEIINIDGGLFDPPPGTLIGNISNIDDSGDIAVGYFSVASVSFSREFINGSQLGIFLQPLCHNSFRRDIPYGCLNCTLIRDSTTERPPYWQF